MIYVSKLFYTPFFYTLLQPSVIVIYAASTIVQCVGLAILDHARQYRILACIDYPEGSNILDAIVASQDMMVDCQGRAHAGACRC